MNKLLVSALMLIASITITTALDFTDEELVQLYNTPVDPQAFIDTIFTLPLTEELYVYNYIVDLIRYLSPGSKLQNFLYSAMALMQRKIDHFSARYNLETKPVQDFLIKGIDIQLKILLESAHRAMKSANNESTKTPLNKMAALVATEDNIDRAITSTLKPLLTKSTKSTAALSKITGQNPTEIPKDTESLKQLPKITTQSTPLSSATSLPKINSLNQKSNTNLTPIALPNNLAKLNSDSSNEIETKLAPKSILQTKASPTLPLSMSFPTNGKPNENPFADLAKILEQNVLQNTGKLQLPKRNISKTGTQVTKTPLTNRNRSLPLANSATPASFSV